MGHGGGRPVINLGKDGRLPAPFAERQRREGGGWVAMGYRGFSMAQENFVFDPGESLIKLQDIDLVWLAKKQLRCFLLSFRALARNLMF